MKYNTAVTVVEIVDADDDEAAVANLAARLRAAGFEPMTDVANYANAFLSEEQ